MKKILIIIFLFFLTGCEFKPVYSVRSGDINNDYIEEPISGGEIKYAATLDTSNSFLDAIKNANYVKAYALCDPSIHKQLTLDQFKELFTTAEVTIGKINEFKKNQWSFNFETENDLKLVLMTKIVKHENATMHYQFIFLKTGDYSKLFGFNFGEKLGLL